MKKKQVSWFSIQGSLIIALFSAAVLMCSVGAPRAAWAKAAGISGYSGKTGNICTNCHSGGTVPTVALTGPVSLTTGSAGVYTLTITGGAASKGGFDVAVSSGTLQATGGGTQLKSSEVVQTAATSFSSGSLSYTFTLVAPVSAGTVTIYATGLSANGNGSTSGDNAAATALAVTVSAPVATAPHIGIADSVAPSGDLQIPFGSVNDGLSSDQTVTITNSGNADLIIGTIGSADPVAPPLSITADTCSGHTIAPAGTCALTVRFAPASAAVYSDSFDIPSNDPATPSAVISVSGTGTAPGAANNPPTAPVLVAPTDGETVNTTAALEWTKSTDPDDDAITYHLYDCTDSSFTTCTPVDVASRMTGIYVAGPGLLFAGFVLTRGGRGKKMMFMLMVTSLLVIGTIISCGGGNSGLSVPAPNKNITHQVTGLASGSTYYWKVVADDGKGGLTSSSTWSFTTQ